MPFEALFFILHLYTVTVWKFLWVGLSCSSWSLYGMRLYHCMNTPISHHVQSASNYDRQCKVIFFHRTSPIDAQPRLVIYFYGVPVWGVKRLGLLFVVDQVILRLHSVGPWRCTVQRCSVSSLDLSTVTLYSVAESMQVDPKPRHCSLDMPPQAFYLHLMPKTVSNEQKLFDHCWKASVRVPEIFGDDCGPFLASFIHFLALGHTFNSCENQWWQNPFGAVSDSASLGSGVSVIIVVGTVR